MADLCRINFGSGTDYRKGWLNIDADKKIKADQYFDLNEFPYPLPDNTFEFIYCDNLIEHLHNPIGFLQECKRILKRNGTLHIIYPNMFYWKLRIKYLLGSILWSNHWSPYHYNTLFKPEWAIIVLRMMGFDIFEGQTPKLFWELRTPEINIKCRKRP